MPGRGGINIVGDVIDELLAGGSSGYSIMGAAQSAEIQERPLDTLQRLPLGIGLTSVPASSATTITVSPQIPAYKIERFISQSVSFTISDIKVGTQSQLVGGGGVPIEIFARDAVGVGLKGDTAYPGIDIALAITNLLAAANPCSGSYLGLAAS